MAQCLRLHLPMQGVRAQSLVKELRSHITRCQKAKTEQKHCCNKFNKHFKKVHIKKKKIYKKRERTSVCHKQASQNSSFHASLNPFNFFPSQATSIIGSASFLGSSSTWPLHPDISAPSFDNWCLEPTGRTRGLSTAVWVNLKADPTPCRTP